MIRFAREILVTIGQQVAQALQCNLMHPQKRYKMLSRCDAFESALSPNEKAHTNLRYVQRYNNKDNMTQCISEWAYDVNGIAVSVAMANSHAF